MSEKGVFEMADVGPVDPKVEVTLCCDKQQGMLFRINGNTVLVTAELGDTKKLKDGSKVKNMDFFGFDITRCFGCGRSLDQLVWQPYDFGKDDGLDEYLQKAARGIEERKEKEEKKS